MNKGLNFFTYSTLTPEAGCDEAGRGCLAGPVVAAAVILHPDANIQGLNDSKKLTNTQRMDLVPQICSNSIAYAVGSASPEEIDKYNILKASILAMHRALDQLNPCPEHILIDGNKFIPWAMKPFTCVIKGDGIWANIAAASVLAKTHRDALMRDLAKDYPEYAWDSNCGYPTAAHVAALQHYGKTPWHRESYDPVRKINFWRSR